MKKFLFFYKLLFRLLTLSVFLFGSMFTAQTVQAASPCSGNVHLNTVAADETWCASPDATHYITDNVTVLAGVTLTIEPGVTLVTVQDSMWKYLTIQGHLDVLGTADQPVVMSTSNPNLPWGGIFFDGSEGDGSGDISYTTIEKSGANLWPSGFSDGYTQTAVLVKNLPAGKQVNINHSTIRNNVSRGLYVVNSTVNVTDTTFSQNIYPILIEGADSVVTYSGNTFSDNAYPYYDNAGYTIHEDSIFIIEDALTGQNFSLPAQTGLEAYVWWGNTTIPAGVTMSVEPGVTLRKEGVNYLTVKGRLEVIGTQALPVLFTGMPDEEPAVNHTWGGIYFEGSAGDGSADINYATIEKAGSNFSPPDYCWNCGYNQFALLVKDLPAGKQVNINNSIVRDNPIKGLYVINSAVNVTNTTFSKNIYPIWIEGAASVVSYSGNNFVDNTFGYLYGQPNVNYPLPLNAIAINPNALMDHNFSLPAQTGLDAYVFWDGTTIPAGRTMTVEPGATLRTGGNKHIIVQGHLEAAGTPALPIRFSGIPNYSDLAIIDTWGGLIFDGPSGASGHLDHAIVELGGEWWNDNLTTLMIYKLAADKSVVVEHSIVQNSKFVDLAVIDSPTAQVDNNLIKGGNTGVYLATNMIVNNLAVTDQALDGVVVESGYTAEARHLTIARTGRYGFYVSTGGIGLLKNSILSQNTLAVMAEGSGQASLDTNLADANTTFQSGAVTELNTISGSADFEADGYHIQTTSAAFGKGLPGLSVVDIDGDARPSPSGSLPDLGADEVTQDEYNLTVLKIGSGTVTSNPVGITCGTDCSEIYNYNTIVTLTATPATGSVFSGWSGAGCTGIGSCEVTMDTPNKTVTATFNDLPIVTSFTATSPSASLNIPITAFTASDAGGVTGYKITTTATPPAATATGWSVTRPTTFAVASAGTYTLYPWAKDAAGNVSAVFGTPRSVIVLDTIKPVVTSFTATSPSASLNIPITAFTASDARGVTGYKITTSATPPAATATGWSATRPTTFAVASAGTYTLYPWAKDAAGNVSAVFGTPRSVIVDITKPIVTSFTATSPSASLNIPITAFTATDAGGVTGYKITTTATPPAATATGWSATRPTTFAVASAGTYTLYPWAKDAAGNVSAVFGTPRSVIVLDTIKPVVTSFTATSPSASLNIPITAFTATDARGVTGYKITTTATPPAATATGWSATRPTTFAVASAGTYTLYPWAKDAAGNVSAVFGTPRSVIVDITKPIVTSFTATSPSASLNIPITAFTATDARGVTGYKITTTATPPAATATGWSVTRPTTFAVASAGTYTLYPWAKDAAGNVSAVFGTPRSVIVTAQRAINGGFNTYTGVSKIPTSWVNALFAVTDGKDTINKKEGLASVKIVGAAGKTKVLAQVLTLSGVTGSRLTFSFWVKGTSIPVAGLCQGQVMLYSGSVLKLTQTIPCTTGTNAAFQPKALAFNATSAYTKAVIRFTYSKASGTVWFDAVSLVK